MVSHTYGVNAALGYIWIAKQFGAKVPESIGRQSYKLNTALATWL